MREVGLKEGADYTKAFRSLNHMVDEGRSWSGNERNRCFLNSGRTRFADVSAVSGLDFSDDARALASVDWDGDGDLDLFQVNRTAPQIRFLRNDWNNDSNWVAFRLVGKTCNADAIGARVQLVRRHVEQTDVRTLRAGNAFLSQSSKWVHFGLGSNSEIERVEVRWPGGQLESFTGIKPRQRYRLIQGSSAATLERSARPIPRWKSSIPKRSEEVESAQVLLNARLPLPPLPYKSMDGQPQSLLPNTATLVQLWASWCPMCATEMNEFAENKERFRRAGLDVLALSVDGLGSDDSTVTAARTALRARDYPFRAGLASEKLLSQLEVLRTELFSNARPFPVPTCLLIDQNGQLAAVYVGPVSVERVMEDVGTFSASPTELRAAAMPFQGRWLIQPKPTRLAAIATSMRSANHIEFANWYQRRAAPQSAISHCSLAIQAERRGELQKSRLHYKEALQLAPRNAEVQNYVGEFFMRRRDVNSALKRFQAATNLIDQSAADAVSDHVAATCFYNLGAVLIATGQPSAADANLRKALNYDPQHALAHTALAKVLQNKKQWDEAKRHLEAALSSNPQLLPAHVYLGRGFMQQRDWNSAIRQFQQAIAIDDRAIDAHTDLARLLGAQGRTKEAVAHYRRALQLRPKQHDIALQLAWYLATSRDDQIRSGDEALKLARSAVKAKEPPSSLALDILAAAQAETGDFQGAIKTLDRAESLAKGNSRMEVLLRRHRELYEQGKPIRDDRGSR